MEKFVTVQRRVRMDTIRHYLIGGILILIATLLFTPKVLAALFSIVDSEYFVNAPPTSFTTKELIIAETPAATPAPDPALAPPTSDTTPAPTPTPLSPSGQTGLMPTVD